MQTHRGFMPRLRQLRRPSWPGRLRLGHLLPARRARWGVRGTRYGVGGRSALKSGRALISAGAIVAVLSSCAAVEPTIVAEPGVAFSLAVGKTAVINGSGTRITFNEVRNDSRCPVDVTCVWAGDAEVVVTISRNGSPDDTRILSFAPTKNETTSGDLRIRLADLAPVPRQSDGNAPRAYVAQLVVNRT